MKIYKEDLTLHYYDTDPKGLMSPRSILKYFSQLSAIHNDLNNGREVLENGYGWMISKWRVVIESYPKLYSKLRLKTWISKLDRFLVTREFSIEDTSGRVLVKGSSLWVFIDMDRRRPARIREEFINLDLVYEKGYIGGFTRLKSSLGLDKAKEVQVRRFDIDLNQHVNNLVYFDWILDSIDDEFFYSHRLREFEIDYKNEITYPSKVKLVAEKNLEAGTIHHEIYSPGGKVSCLGLTRWEKL